MKFKSDKGVAGLTILLSVIVLLFVIGLIVMIFSLMGGELQNATYTPTTVAVVNESFTPTTAGATLAGGSALNAVCADLTAVWNATNQIPITAANYSQTNCLVANLTGEFPNAWKVTYSYVYDANNTATQVMFDTVAGVSGSIDWFDIFIVVGAMIVLILLTVLIITAIRGSGVVEGSRGANQVGTA